MGGRGSSSHVSILASKVGENGRAQTVRVKSPILGEKSGLVLHKSIGQKGYSLTHKSSGMPMVSGIRSLAKGKDALKSVPNHLKRSRDPIKFTADNRDVFQSLNKQVHGE